MNQFTILGVLNIVGLTFSVWSLIVFGVDNRRPRKPSRIFYVAAIYEIATGAMGMAFTLLIPVVPVILPAIIPLGMAAFRPSVYPKRHSVFMYCLACFIGATAFNAIFMGYFLLAGLRSR